MALEDETAGLPLSALRCPQTISQLLHAQPGRDALVPSLKAAVHGSQDVSCVGTCSHPGRMNKASPVVLLSKCFPDTQNVC